MKFSAHLIQCAKRINLLSCFCQENFMANSGHLLSKFFALSADSADWEKDRAGIWRVLQIDGMRWIFSATSQDCPYEYFSMLYIEFQGYIFILLLVYGHCCFTKIVIIMTKCGPEKVANFCYMSLCSYLVGSLTSYFLTLENTVCFLRKDGKTSDMQHSCLWVNIISVKFCTC